MTADAEKLNRQVLDAVAALLRAKGWDVAVVGGTHVEKHSITQKFNFQFVVNFTGTPPKEPQEPSHDR